MKKKVLSIIIIAVVAIVIIGGGSYIYLSKNSIKNDMTQANTLMNEGNYTAALSEYGVVLNKDPNNTEAKNMENIINGYLTAKNDYDQGQIQAAMTAINGIKNYSGYAIADNINGLKNKIETSEKQIVAKNAQEPTKNTVKVANTEKSQSISNTVASDKTNNQKNDINTVVPKANTNENNKTNQNTTQNITKEAQKSNSGNLVTKQDYLDQLNATKKSLNNYISGQSQTAMNAQSYEMYSIWNNKLNQIWGVLEQRLPADKMTALRTSEDAWIKDKEAKAQAVQKQYEGGSIMPLEVNMELANLTEQRCYYLVNNYM